MRAACKADNFQASKSFKQRQQQKQLQQLQQHLQQQQQQSLLSFPNSVIHFSPNVSTQSHLAQFSQSLPPACAQQQTCCSSHQHLMPDLEGTTSQSNINSAACIDLLGKTEENAVVDANVTGQNDAVATFLPHLQLDISKLTSIAMSGIPASFSGIDSSWFVSARNGESCTLHLNGTTQPSLPLSGSPASGNPSDATHLFTSAGLVNSSLSVNDRQSQESRASDSPYNALGHNFMFLSQKNPLTHAGLLNDGAAENANCSDPSSVISWLKCGEQDQQHTNFAPHNFFKFQIQSPAAVIGLHAVQLCKRRGPDRPSIPSRLKTPMLPSRNSSRRTSCAWPIRRWSVQKIAPSRIRTCSRSPIPIQRPVRRTTLHRIKISSPARCRIPSYTSRYLPRIKIRSTPIRLIRQPVTSINSSSPTNWHLRRKNTSVATRISSHPARRTVTRLIRAAATVPASTRTTATTATKRRMRTRKMKMTRRTTVEQRKARRRPRRIIRKTESSANVGTANSSAIRR